MIAADMHVHSSYSFDAFDSPKQLISSAIKKGMKQLAITDHQDWVPDTDEMTFDEHAFYNELSLLREEHKNQIELLIGTEIGILQGKTEEYRAYSKSLPFDFIIGSVHFVNGKDPYYPEYFKGRSFEESYREAFQCTIACLNEKPDIDVLGHLDYVVRYGDQQNGDGFYYKYADEIDEILQAIIAQGIGLEVNTAALRKGLPAPNPNREVLKRYRELGGEIVTVGSDAHESKDIGADFSEICQILSTCGFSHYAYFRNRTPVFQKL